MEDHHLPIIGVPGRGAFSEETSTQKCVQNVITSTTACNNFQCGNVPPGTVALKKQVYTNEDGSAACACIADGCKDNYVEQGGFCVLVIECDLGYRQEGNACLPIADASCYDVPQSPLCIPPLCDEHPIAADGTDLVAEGLCVDAPPPPTESCTTGCHADIENPHPWFGGPQLTCTGCHGGNATETTQQKAHVPIPTQWQEGSAKWGRPNLRYYFNYATLIGVENFPNGLEWLRFTNPGDLRVADQSCGKSGCHQARVENTRRSVMTTTPGLAGGAVRRVGGPRAFINGTDGIYKWDTTMGYTLGQTSIEALSAAYDATMVGSVPRMANLAAGDREQNGAYSEIDVLLEPVDKVCGNCHLGHKGGFGFGQRYADFRGSGCSACHSAYGLDGRSRSRDQMINKNEPSYPAAYAAMSNFNVNDLQNANGTWLGPERSHPLNHRITRAVGSRRCGSCHFGSNRTDWQYRGYRFDPNRDSTLALDNGRLNADQIQFTDEIDNNANPFARYHGAQQNQVLKYEDWNNDGQDDTPADVHWVAGLECIDCHTSGEMHNELKFVKVAKVTDWSDPNQVKDMSGALWSKQDQATEIECVHCHGNLEFRALPFVLENRNPIKNMIVCPETDETLPGYTTPAECGALGRGRWLKGKYTGRWHYVSQVKDTAAGNTQGVGGVVRPDSTSVYTPNASIFHGRFNNTLADGAGPCPNGDINNCYQDQGTNTQPVTQGFSHLGKPADSPVDQMSGGLECYTCHSTWIHACFGCHVTVADNDGTQKLYEFSRSSGKLTLGQLVQADFGYVDPLAIQFGINSEGKIAQMNPMEKLFIRQIDIDGNDYFGNRTLVNNNANTVYNIYRDRAGYGTRQYNTERVGLPLNADGPLVEQDARMDQNAGQGFNQVMPHTTQRAWGPLMDCNACHLDANAGNTNAIQARYGANPNGFANVSAYLNALNGLQIARNYDNQVLNIDANVGFRFDQNTDPDAYVVDIQSDWVVIAADGFPLAYNNHPMKNLNSGITLDPQYQRTYPRMAPIAGPLNTYLLNKVLNVVKTNNEGVPFKAGRR